MKALIFDGKDLALHEDHPKPGHLQPLIAAKKFGDGTVTFPSETLVTVRPMRVGICGTDLAIMAGVHGSAPPVVLGHEIVGVVESVGSSVTHLKPKDRVGVDANVPCGNCSECRRGAKNRCLDLTTAGIFFDGGMAQQMLMPASQLIPIPGSIPWDTAALFEPLSCVVHGLLQLPHLIRGAAVVIGGGPIGLLWALSLRAVGIREIALVEPAAYRRQIAADLGISPIRARSSFLEDSAYDIVIDAAGVPALGPELIRLARSGGQISLFGQQKAEAVVDGFPIVEANQKELAIVGSYATADEFEETIELLERPLPWEKLITHRFSLRDAKEGFAAMEEGRSMKVLILPNGEEA